MRYGNDYLVNSDELRDIAHILKNKSGELSDILQLINKYGEIMQNSRHPRLYRYIDEVESRASHIHEIIDELDILASLFKSISADIGGDIEINKIEKN